MRTRLSICRKKARYRSYEDALAAARGADIALRPYYCDRCWQFHLTGRIKGKWLPRGQSQAEDPSKGRAAPPRLLGNNGDGAPD